MIILYLHIVRRPTGLSSVVVGSPTPRYSANEMLLLIDPNGRAITKTLRSLNPAIFFQKNRRSFIFYILTLNFYEFARKIAREKSHYISEKQLIQEYLSIAKSCKLIIIMKRISSLFWINITLAHFILRKY